MHTKFSILFAVISVLFLLTAQARFIASDKVSSVAPLSHADLDIKLQGRRDMHHNQAVYSQDGSLNDSDQNKLNNKPAPGAKRTEVSSFTASNDKNVGNLAVGFGENAPANITNRSSVHLVSENRNHKSSDYADDFEIRRNDKNASDAEPNNSRRPGQGSSSKNGRYANKPKSLESKKEEASKLAGAKAEISFIKAHPKFNKAEPGQSFSTADFPVGLSEEQMKLRKKKPTVFIRNPYEISLKQVYLLTEQSGDLALTKAQAKKILYYINCIENAKDSEDKAYNEIKKILSPQQQQTINVYLSGRMKHDSGPKLEDTDPLAAALKAIEN